jgi:hypothetical protein
MRIRIIAAQEVERTLGENEPEPDGRSGRILLDEGDVRAAALAAELVGEVEAGGPGTDDQDLQASSAWGPSPGPARPPSARSPAEYGWRETRIGPS